MPTSIDARALAHACRFIECIADASASGEVISEEEMPNGHYLVAEEWPSLDAYLAFAAHRQTLEAMVAISRR